MHFCMRLGLSIVVPPILMLSACAKPVEKIHASYVTPFQYESYTCDQLAKEAHRLSSHAAQAMGVQKDAAAGDALKMGVAIVLFWPAALMIEGNGANEAEVARLMGEMEAVEQSAIQKNCEFEFVRPEPPKREYVVPE